jgi:CheY-like chemotaxis protein
MSERAILCVDDEKNILMALKRLLRKEEYTIHLAGSGEEGLTILGTNPIQVVLSDQRMPGMTGIEFLQKVKDNYPHTVRVILSGFADAHMIVDSINQGEVYRFLGKPWNDDELKAIIRQCFERWELLKQNNELMEQTKIQNEELRKLNEGLEDMVEERTRFLQLSQEILEHLPVAVVGIARDGLIVITNEVARKTISSLVPGQEMQDVIPVDIRDMIERNLGNGSTGESCLCSWDGLRLRMHIKPLECGGVVRGCLLMLEDDKGAEDEILEKSGVSQDRH